MAIDTASESQPSMTSDTARISGHPAGLRTLFFTEMWERFSYYGMRSILILFLLGNNGLHFDLFTATTIYGLYTSSVYLAGLPGGWIGDRILGYRRAVFVGGVLIAAGHFGLAFGSVVGSTFGLGLIVIGTGLLKPNINAIVGDLYPEGGARRDAGFSVFYMGITLGAFIGPIVCGYLGERIAWRLGFAAAGVGMVLGLIQYRLGLDRLGEAGRRTLDPKERDHAIRLLLAGIGVVALIAIVLVLLEKQGALDLSPSAVAELMGFTIGPLVVIYFGYHLIFGGFNASEKKRIIMIIILFAAASMFWCGFEQAGLSMNLFADRYTDLVVFGTQIPSSWLQSVNALMVIAFAPVFAYIWLRLSDRQPSMPAKFALGLIQLGIGFGVLAWASVYVGDQGNPNKVGMGWLIATYFFHTTGELCISPVGLSAVTKLSPDKLVSQMIGVWFLGTSIGNLMAGLLAGTMESIGLVPLFTSVAIWTAAAGLVLLVISRPIKRLLDH